MVDEDFRTGHLVALDEQGVLPGLELQVVAQVHGGHDDAHVQGELAADGADAGQQVAALFLVHQGDEPVAHLQLQGIKRPDGRCLIKGLLFTGSLSCSRLLFNHLGHLTGHPPHQPGDSGKQQKGKMRQPRNQGKQEHHAGNHIKGLWIVQELAGNLLTEIILIGASGHKDTCSCRDNQCRYLGHQPLTYRQQCVVGQGNIQRKTLLPDTDNQPAKDINQHNQNAGNGIATYKLAGAVHGPVKLSLPPDLFTADSSLFLCQKAGREIGINGHLLARHRVQSKTG